MTNIVFFSFLLNFLEAAFLFSQVSCWISAKQQTSLLFMKHSETPDYYLHNHLKHL